MANIQNFIYMEDVLSAISVLEKKTQQSDIFNLALGRVLFLDVAQTI